MKYLLWLVKGGVQVDCDYDRLKRLIDTADKSEEFILYNNEKWIKEKYSVPTEKIKDKIEELENAYWYCENVKNQTIEALKELLEESEEKRKDNNEYA